MLARGCWSEVERFGLRRGSAAPGPDWTIAVDGAILLGGAPQGTLRVRAQLGRHNQLNALAALAAARHAGVPVRARPRGARRRSAASSAGWRCAARVRGVTVYDDFAHHPTAIATTIDGLRRDVGGARILAVLEPRSNTMKLGAMKDALPGSLARADRVFCYAGEPRLGRRRRARAARREGARVTTTSTALVDGDRAPRRAPAITCS